MTDDLRAQIEAAMRAQGVGVTELSRRMGRSTHKHLSDVLRGRHEPGEAFLCDVARALAVELRELPRPGRRYLPSGVVEGM